MITIQWVELDDEEQQLIADRVSAYATPTVELAQRELATFGGQATILAHRMRKLNEAALTAYNP